MNRLVDVIVIAAAFLCGASLSPTSGTLALGFALALTILMGVFLFSAYDLRPFGIAIGISCICSMIFATLMFKSVPDVLPPYPSGWMQSLFPDEKYPSSEKSLDLIDSRLHLYGLLGSLPITLIIGSLFASRWRKNRAQSGRNGD